MGYVVADEPMMRFALALVAPVEGFSASPDYSGMTLTFPAVARSRPPR